LTKCHDDDDDRAVNAAGPFDHFDDVDHFDHLEFLDKELDDHHETMERYFAGSLRPVDVGNGLKKIISKIEVVRHDGDAITKYETTSHTDGGELSLTSSGQPSNGPGAYTKITKKTVIKQANGDENGFGESGGTTKTVGESASKSQTMTSILGGEDRRMAANGGGVPSTADGLQNGMRTTITKTVTSESATNGQNGFANGSTRLLNNIIGPTTSGSSSSNYDDDDDTAAAFSRSTPIVRGGDVDETTTSATIAGNGFAGDRNDGRQQSVDGSFVRRKATTTTTTTTTAAVKRQNSNGDRFGTSDEGSWVSRNILSTNPSNFATSSVTNAADDVLRANGDGLTGTPDNRLTDQSSLENSVTGHVTDFASGHTNRNANDAFWQAHAITADRRNESGGSYGSSEYYRRRAGLSFVDANTNYVKLSSNVYGQMLDNGKPMDNAGDNGSMSGGSSSSSMASVGDNNVYNGDNYAKRKRHRRRGKRLRRIAAKFGRRLVGQWNGDGGDGTRRELNYARMPSGPGELSYSLSHSRDLAAQRRQPPCRCHRDREPNKRYGDESNAGDANEFNRSFRDDRGADGLTRTVRYVSNGLQGQYPGPLGPPGPRDDSFDFNRFRVPNLNRRNGRIAAGQYRTRYPYERWSYQEYRNGDDDETTAPARLTRLEPDGERMVNDAGFDGTRRPDGGEFGSEQTDGDGPLAASRAVWNRNVISGVGNPTTMGYTVKTIEKTNGSPAVVRTESKIVRVDPSG